jgi:hypothetical protein
VADYVNGAFAYLQAWVNTFRQHYAPGIMDQLKRHGKTTRIMPTAQRVMDGSNIEYEVQAYHNRSTRASLDLMEAMPDPGPGRFLRFNVRFDHTDSSANDIVALEIGFRTTVWDIWKRGDSLFKGDNDFVGRDVEQGLSDVKEAFARYLHLPNDGRLAIVQTIRNDDSDIFSSCTTYTAASTAACIQLDPVSIARIGDGQIVEFRTAAGVLRANNIRVSYVHPFDNTIAVEIDSTLEPVDSAGAAVTNLDSLAADDEIFLSGSYNVAPSGTLNRFFDVTQTYYQRDRTDPAFKMLQPIRLDVTGGGANVPIEEDHFTRVGETVGWMGGDGNAVNRRALVMSRNEFRGVTRFVKDSAMQLTPGLESQVGREFNRAFGHDGFVLHDPNLGTVMVVVDDFAEYGNVDFLDLDEVYSAQGIQAFAFVCKWPKGQARLQGLDVNE